MRTYLASEIGNARWVPCSKALRVAKIGALIGRLLGALGRLQPAEEVHLLGGIVLVDILVVAHYLIRRIFHAVEAATTGLLVNSNVVAQAPPQKSAVGIEIVRSAGKVVQVEGFDLAMTCAELSSFRVNVGRAATSDNKRAILLL